MLLYSPAVDPFLEELMKNADRVFYFEEGPRAAADGCQVTSEDAEGSDHAGSIFVNWPEFQWPRRSGARVISPGA